MKYTVHRLDGGFPDPDVPQGADDLGSLNELMGEAMSPISLLNPVCANDSPIAADWVTDEPWRWSWRGPDDQEYGIFVDGRSPLAVVRTAPSGLGPVCPSCTVTYSPPEPWISVEAGQVRVGDIIVRNVVVGMEWVPGPYGAFLVEAVATSEYHDDVTIHTVESWGPVEAGSKMHRLEYLSDERVVVCRKSN